MLKVGIFGASGFVGEELANILFEGEFDTDCNNFSIKKAAQLCELAFLALPHTVSMDFVPALLKKNLKVIDFSADYRFREAKIYQKWYQKKHKDKKNLKSAVYGLPEIFRDKIKKTNLVANPGCYPTAAILAIAPLLKKKMAAVDLGLVGQVIGVDKKTIRE